MTLDDFKKLKLSRKAGVYLFKKGRVVLYVGRATVLAERVRSYFDRDLYLTRGNHVARLPSESDAVETIETDSVLEAIMLEAALIKKFSPPYNTDLKDNKSFWLIVITEEDFPRVLLVRSHTLQKAPSGSVAVKGGSLAKIHKLFGPFPNAGELKEAMHIIRRIFPFRDACVPYNAKSIAKSGGRACFNKQIGLCPGVCDGTVDRTRYARTIRHLELFLQGRKGDLVEVLRREQKKAVKKLHFEEAGVLQDKIFALNHIRDVALLKRGSRVIANGEYRVEGYDVSHHGGEHAYGVMTVIKCGVAEKSEYRSFKIKGAKGGDDVGALHEVLTRRLAHPEWQYPRLIVVDGGIAQHKIAERVLAENGIIIPVVAVTKDEHHRPKKLLGDTALRRAHESDILLANSEAHRYSLRLHRNVREKVKGTR